MSRKNGKPVTAAEAAAEIRERQVLTARSRRQREETPAQKTGPGSKQKEEITSPIKAASDRKKLKAAMEPAAAAALSPQQITGREERAKYDRSSRDGIGNLLITEYLSEDDTVEAREARLVNEAIKNNLLLFLSTRDNTYNMYDLNKTLCRIPPSKTLTPCDYTGTVRFNGLYEILTELDDSSTLLSKNLLKSDDKPMKYDIAFQAEDTNPNGVLATCLSNALEYLSNVPRGQPRFTGIRVPNKEGETLFPLDNCLETIEEIKNAARSATGGTEKEKGIFKAFSSALLEAYMNKIDQPGSDPEDKMISILKVYGALLNKGLSDTAQGGEAIKVWLLKIIDLKIRMEREGERERERLAAEGSDEASSPEYVRLQSEFWRIVHGIPFLKLISSDKIASALYLRLTKHFKGGVSSIQPVKANGGDSSIFYLQKKFVSLIMEMKHSSEKTEVGRILQEFYTRISRFARITAVPNLDREIFPKIDEIVKCLYQLTPDSEFKSIDDCLNNLQGYMPYIQAYIDALKAHRDTGGVISDWDENLQDNKDCIDLLFVAGKGLYNQELEDFVPRMDNLKTLLENFGTLITNLSQYVATNEVQLEAIFNQLPEDTADEADYVWSMLAETVGYYDSCKDLHDKSVDDLVALYLDICKEEIIAAFCDVYFGHDQVHIDPESQQKLGGKFFEILFPQERVSFMQDLRSQGHGQGPVKEDEYSKAQMDKDNYIAVTQTGDRSIYFKKTSKFSEDPINAHTKAKTFQGKQYSGPVCGTVYSSIDFYVGKVFEIGSKININNGFKTFAELMFFLQNHPFKEIRTVSTAADLAAPPGCLYVEAGNMAVSYRILNSSDGKQFIYIISTFNLDRHAQNIIDFTAGQCLRQATPESFQAFFSPDELEEYQPRNMLFGGLFSLLEETSKKIFANNKNDKIRFVQAIEEIIKKNPQLIDNNDKTLFYKKLTESLQEIQYVTSELLSLGVQKRVATKISQKEVELRNLREQLYIAFIKLTRDNYIRLFDLARERIKEGNPGREDIRQEIIDMMTIFEIINDVQPDSMGSGDRVSASSYDRSLAPISASKAPPPGVRSFFKTHQGTGPDRRGDGSGTPLPEAPSMPAYHWLILDDDVRAVLVAQGIDMSNSDAIVESLVNDFCEKISVSKREDCKERYTYLLNTPVKRSYIAHDLEINGLYSRFRTFHNISGLGIFGGSKRTRKKKRNKKNKRTKRTNKYNGTSKTKRSSRRRRRNRLTKRH